MVDYSLVSRSINDLADRIGAHTDRKLRHEESMVNLGLQGTKLDLDANRMKNQQQLSLAQQQQQNYLNEEITGQQWLAEAKLSDTDKQRLMQTWPEELMAMPFKRGQFSEAFARASEGLSRQAQHSEKIGLQKQQLADQRSYNAERNKIARLNAENKGVTPAAQKYTDQRNMNYLTGKYGITTALDGSMIMPTMTPDQFGQFRQEAADLGYSVDGKPTTVTENDNDWIPFNEKDVEMRQVTGFYPSRVGGPPESGMRYAQQGPGAQPKTPLFNELEGLLQAGYGLPNAEASVVQQAQAVQQPQVQQVQPPQPQQPEIVQRGNRFYRMTDQGAVELTPEEIRQMRANSPASQWLDTAFRDRTTAPRGAQTGLAQPSQRGY